MEAKERQKPVDIGRKGARPEHNPMREWEARRKRRMRREREGEGYGEGEGRREGREERERRRKNETLKFKRPKC